MSADGNFQGAYIVGNLVFGLPIWVILFACRKDLRKEILFSSLLIGILAPLWEPWFLRDYWHPESLDPLRIAIGDFLYGFFIGGIASAIYEEVLGKRFARRKNRDHHWSWLLIPFAALGVLVFNIPVLLGVNSIYAAALMFLFLAGFIVFFRRDLLIDAFVSGLFTGIITLSWELVVLSMYPGIIHAWWKLSNLSGVFVMGIPSEELLWAFGIGMVLGPFYEFARGLRFSKRT